MPPVVTSDDLPIWLRGEATCNSCGKHWTAVWPAGADNLECPACESDDTEREAL